MIRLRGLGDAGSVQLTPSTTPYAWKVTLNPPDSATLAALEQKVLAQSPPSNFYKTPGNPPPNPITGQPVTNALDYYVGIKTASDAATAQSLAANFVLYQGALPLVAQLQNYQLSINDGNLRMVNLNTNQDVAAIPFIDPTLYGTNVPVTMPPVANLPPQYVQPESTPVADRTGATLSSDQYAAYLAALKSGSNYVPASASTPAAGSTVGSTAAPSSTASTPDWIPGVSNYLLWGGAALAAAFVAFGGSKR